MLPGLGITTSRMNLCAHSDRGRSTPSWQPLFRTRLPTSFTERGNNHPIVDGCCIFALTTDRTGQLVHLAQGEGAGYASESISELSFGRWLRQQYC